MITKSILLENFKPLAIIVKGNPKYIEDPRVKIMASKFYEEIRRRLVARGFRVAFDPGEEFTRPSTKAKLWVAHSRGKDRLQYAPETVQTLALETENDTDGYSPDHYVLSRADVKALERA